MSILVHCAGIVGGISLVQINSSLPPAVAQPPRTFFVFLQAMRVDFRMPHAPVPVLKVPVAEPRVPEPRIAVVEVLPPTHDEPRAAIEPAVAKPAVPRGRDPLHPIVDPTPRTVVVGAFENGVARPAAVQSSREIRAAGFDAAPARAPELKIGAAKVGAFDAPAGVADPRPGTDRPTQGVAVGGFGNASGMAAPPSPSDRIVVSAGFGSSAHAGPQAPTPLPTQIRAAGFDSQAVAPNPTSKDTAIARRLDTPVEVIFKPTPDYTDEARALKIEGEVVLEVQFTADGRVRVIRTVHGLGHGLDEAAVRAAERVRFKPAQSGGMPTDVRTTVHIVFRLT